MPDQIVMLDQQSADAISHWGAEPGSWQLVGFVRSAIQNIARPIIEIAGERYVLRRQPADLTENDTIFRHAFMRHLRAQGLPVPDLLQRPDGQTYTMLEDGIYELQTWLDGQEYLSNGPASDERIEQAGATLALLHQASSTFQWRQHQWPLERSTAAIAQAYIGLIHSKAEDQALSETARAGLERIAYECTNRLDDAVEALGQMPGPPELHLHGDYQAHNLSYSGANVSAIYDFDTTHWGRRIDELAYSLLYFTGVRWDGSSGVTPPLAPEGLDLSCAQLYLNSYGREAPPAEGEAKLLGAALTLAFPVVFANGVMEDVMFPEDFEEAPEEPDILERLQWGETFWLWLDRYQESLGQAWSAAAGV